MDRALIIGRFQPFHKGHVHLINYSRPEEVIIVIGSAYESFTFENPFTAGERYLMIHSVLREMNINFYIVPVPDINRYGVYAKHVIDMVPEFNRVISNNKIVKEIFEREGYEVEEVPPLRRGEYQGRVIRKKIAEGQKWEHLVPKMVADYIKRIGGDERIRRLYNQPKL